MINLGEGERGGIPIEFDLKRLAGMHDPGRGFLSVYLAGPNSLEGMEKRMSQLRRVLADEPMDGSEREKFDGNVRLVREYLEKNQVYSPTAIFAGAALGFFQDRFSASTS